MVVVCAGPYHAEPPVPLATRFGFPLGSLKNQQAVPQSPLNAVARLISMRLSTKTTYSNKCFI